MVMKDVLNLCSDNLVRGSRWKEVGVRDPEVLGKVLLDQCTVRGNAMVSRISAIVRDMLRSQRNAVSRLRAPAPRCDFGQEVVYYLSTRVMATRESFGSRVVRTSPYSH